MYHFQRIESPIGKILLIANENGLCFAEFEDDTNSANKLDTIAKKLNHTISNELNLILKDTADQLDRYFKKDLTKFNIALEPIGTDFQKSVWNSLQEIPFGKIKTYKIQSENLKSPDAIRAIASANGKNPIAVIIPCHRVIGSDGTLTGYAGGLWRKKWLLEHEGALNVAQQSLF
jgi:O-6-methylguanine DNA methyltransferase